MKIPKPRKLQSGMWFIQLRLGGESIPITEPTEKECIKVARLIKSEYLAGRRTKPAGCDLTLGQAIDDYIAPRDGVLSPSTIHGYQKMRKHRFKGYMSQSIKNIDNWQKMCNIEARLVSAKTLKNAWGLVVSVLREIAGIDPPEVVLPEVVEPDPKFLEPEQILMFLKEIEGVWWEPEALIYLHGLRLSEQKAIDPKTDFDFLNDIIKIRGARVRGPNGLVDKETNKNKTSRRDVPLLIPRLKEVTLNPNEAVKKYSARSDGAIRDNINKVCKRLGFTEVGIHGLRHTFASLCYDLGIPERIAMQFGGWKDRETMHKIYVHLSKRSVARSQTELKRFFADPEKQRFEADSLPYRVASFMAIESRLKARDREEIIQQWATAIDELLQKNANEIANAS